MRRRIHKKVATEPIDSQAVIVDRWASAKEHFLMAKGAPKGILTNLSYEDKKFLRESTFGNNWDSETLIDAAKGIADSIEE